MGFNRWIGVVACIVLMLLAAAYHHMSGVDIWCAAYIVIVFGRDDDK